jgi:hypothetical protein
MATRRYWIQKNGKGQWVEEEQPTPPTPAARQKVAVASPVVSDVEVRLFEAVRDAHLSLAEWRIALALEKKSLPEKAAALSKELDALVLRVNQSGASVAALLFTQRAVAGMKQMLTASTDGEEISRASRDLLAALDSLVRREAKTDEELRARALAMRARSISDDDQAKFGIR